MLTSILTKTIYDRWRSLIWWGLGVIALALSMLAFYPTVRDQSQQFERLLAVYPNGILALFGVQGAEGFASPAGYLRIELFSFMVPMIFLILAIGMGSAAVAGEEDRKTLDLLLSTPVSRVRVVLEKFLAMLAILSLMALVLWLALVLGASGAGMDIGAGKLAAMSVSTMLLSSEFGTLALALGSASGKRGMSMGVSAALAVAAFLINSLAELVSALGPYKKFSPFYHYIGENPLSKGLNLAHASAMLAVIIVLLGIALVTFQRRDIAV